MQYSFFYDKKKVIHGLRYHFISRPEIKGLLIVINIFAVAAAFLFYFKKIKPQPFILSSLLWMALMIIFWFILPNVIYRRSATFKDKFVAQFYSSGMELENEKGRMAWEWEQFQSFFESPNFFHLYFNQRTFFLLPKDGMSLTMQEEVRRLLAQNIASGK